MSETTPRLRMFAGPNGSGKSTLKSYLPPALLGVYLNPDDLEQQIVRQGFLDLSAYGVATSGEEILSFFQNSAFLDASGLGDETKMLSYSGGLVDFRRVTVNSYLASVTTEFIRQKLLIEKRSFTFETVMSHPGKVDFLARAQAVGYRTYLYFVATDDPAINVSRVRNRVKLGGHPVPEDRITNRYYRSLELLMDAIRYTNRAYVFDNSRENADGKHTWIAEITDGWKLELKADQVPAWFTRAVLDKIK